MRGNEENEETGKGSCVGAEKRINARNSDNGRNGESEGE